MAIMPPLHSNTVRGSNGVVKSPDGPKNGKIQSGLMAIFTSLMFIWGVGKRKTLVVSLKTVSISPSKALAKMLKMFSQGF